MKSAQTKKTSTPAKAAPAVKAAPATKAAKTAPAVKAAPAQVAAPAKGASASKVTKAAAASVKAPGKKSKAVPAAGPSIVRPVRNRTAYMMFVKDHRKSTQSGNPSMDFVAVTKDIAQRWNALSEAERKPFHDRANSDKERYEREVTAFRTAHPGEALTIKKKKRVVKIKGPKKARSAYVFYTKEVRQSVQDSNPEADFGTVTKQIASQWNALTAAQKSKYEKLATEDRTRFEAENKEFNEAHPEVKRRKAKAKKNAPKKARSAYLFFTMEKRAQFKASNPDKDFGGLTKLVADDWKKLNAAAKKKYEKLADDDRNRYTEEMKGYKRPTDEELDADEPRKAKRADGPKRPLSAYLYYTAAERAKITAAGKTDQKFADITKQIATTWKALSPREREKFDEMAAADKTRYTNELAAKGK